MSLLARYTTPAERRRYCVASFGFERADLLVENMGPGLAGADVITGSPVIDFGAELDSSTPDYFNLNLDVAKNIFNHDPISFVIEFTPNFDYDDGETRVFFSAGVPLYSIYKFADDNIELNMGGTAIAVIASATYSAYWAVNERNVLVVSSTSGDTNVWLNGTQILTNDATAWTFGTPDTCFTIGTDCGDTGDAFDGTLHSVKFFHSLLTADEALDYYNYGAIS